MNSPEGGNEGRTSHGAGSAGPMARSPFIASFGGIHIPLLDAINKDAPEDFIFPDSFKGCLSLL